MKITRRRALFATLGLLILFAAIWEGRRFRERWYAIAAQGGQSFAMPPLTTAHYRQHDPRWADDSIGGLGESMARMGCTVCSLAMALDYFGVKQNPKEVNEFLKTHDGYNMRGWLRWKCAEQLANGHVTIDVLSKPSHAAIDQALRNRELVIAIVYIKGVVPHWVLVVGKDGNEYLMRDPLMDEGALGRISDYGAKIYALRIMRQSRPVQ